MFATTGMDGFDYLIGDDVVAPQGEEAAYCERIVRVPGCYLTFNVAHAAPEVAPSPAGLRGQFTFGSLASLYKITPDVRTAWAAVLLQTTNSRLLIRNKGLQSSENRSWLRDRFAELGVAPERLELMGPADHFQFLETYGEVDLALDTFPYNGGTTTSEALWQGVPVVAYRGDRWSSRVSASLLENAGLSEFIARDAEDYIHLAAAIANDSARRERLADMRMSLRAQLSHSPVCDAEGFVHNMEQIYRQIIDHPNPKR